MPMIRKLIISATICALLGCSAMNERSMLTRINAHQNELSEIWSGYDANTRFYGYLDADRHVYLNRSAAAPEKFQLSENGLWKSHRRYPELNGIFHINAELAPDLEATLIEAGARKNYLALTSLMLHEDFHGYQRDVFSEHGADTLAYAETGDIPVPELFAAVRFERRLLQSIIENFDNVAKRDDLIVGYIAHRQTRNTILPASFSETENSIERSEGTATWFEMHAMRHLGFVQDISAILYRRLQSSSEEFGSDLSTRLFSQRLYGSGAAICEVLERLAVPDWQSAIADGQSPFSLLQTQFPLTTEAAIERTKLLQSTAAFQEELTNASRFNIPTSALQQFEDISENYAYSVTFALARESETTFDYSFSASRILSLPNGLLLPKVSRFNASAGRLQINITHENVILIKLPSEEGANLYRHAFSLLTDQVYWDNAQLRAGTHYVNTAKLNIPGVEFIGDTELKIVIEDSIKSNNNH